MVRRAEDWLPRSTCSGHHTSSVFSEIPSLVTFNTPCAGGSSGLELQTGKPRAGEAPSSSTAWLCQPPDRPAWTLMTPALSSAEGRWAWVGRGRGFCPLQPNP